LRASRLAAAAALVCGVGVQLSASPASAAAITHTRTVSDTDFVSAGVSGLGNVGTGTISVSGVNGSVTKALLFWNGNNWWTPDAVYEASTASVNGHPVVGEARGDAAHSCSSPGSSRTYVSDVTALVSGNGSYHIGVQSGAPGDNTEGATMVVFFDDGNPDNDRDVVLFEGNDANVAEGFPGEDQGWHAVLPGIDMPAAGTAGLQLHVARGSSAVDGTITVSGPGGVVDIEDQVGRWDGATLPDAGHRYLGTRGVMDIESFDITGATAAGENSIHIDHDPVSDCLTLVAALVDVPVGAAPAAPPACSVNDVALDEGDAGTTDFVFTVSRTSGVGTASIDFASDGVSADDLDFVGTSGTVSFADTELSKPVAVPVNGDVEIESDELFRVNLSNATGCVLADPNGDGSIVDDDAPVTPECGTPGTNRVSVGDAQVFEGDSGALRQLRFPVTLSNPSGSDVTVTYRLHAGSASYPADLATKTDLTKTLKFKVPTSGSMVTTKFVSVKVVPDTLPEGDEHLTMELFSASGDYSIGRRFGQATIRDDDLGSGPAVAIAGSSLCEGDTSAKGNRFLYQISLRHPAAAETVVPLTITDGTATGSVDYKAVPKPKNVKFKAGQVQKTMAVWVFPETDVETTETVVGTLLPSVLSPLPSTANGVIFDDD
jgi:hypothetical protein